MSETLALIEAAWRGETLEAMKRFVSIPAKNRGFDAEWESRGFLLRAVEEAARWGAERFPGAEFRVMSRPGVTPALFFDIPATGGHDGRPVFFYGHLDKQPETEGWREGLGPWTPVVENGCLYGRGAADDGYSFYAALTALMALDRAGIARPRATGLFETDEEGGSGDLKAYLEKTAPEVGSPAFICILDLCAKDYDRLWTTQSLRGIILMKLCVKVLELPVHSGTSSGFVPSSFDVMRQLLDRLSDPVTGRVRVAACWPEFPKDHEARLRAYAARCGSEMAGAYAWSGKTQPRTTDPYEAVLRTTWEPTLSFVGMDGMPPTAQASGLIRASTSLLLSFRIPPRVDAKKAFEAIRETLTTNVPSSATVEVSGGHYANGFDTPAPDKWLRDAWREAGIELFGNEPMSLYEGASIGTMEDFARFFPESSFLGTGVLGPGSNAHAPNECLRLDYVTRLTEAIARVVSRIPRA